MKQLFIFIFVCCAFQLNAQQTLNLILQEIEQNNTWLLALRSQAEAEKIGNRTGLNPENPEVEYHYLWGNNAEMGNRTDFSATQSFDFPTAYYHKRKVADAQDQQVDLKYQIAQKEVLLDAKKICVQLIYQQTLASELEKRLIYAQQIADALQTQFEKGDINILDMNKAKFNLLNVQKEFNFALAEKEFLLAELKRLNGGKELVFSLSEFPKVLLPADFASWYAEQKMKNYYLQSLQQETILSQKNEKLQRSMNLPKISAGYMSEKVLSEHFQGVMIGISVPLWENKNTVKQIKAQTIALRANEEDANLRSYNEAKALYEKARNLQKILLAYQQNALSGDTAELLKKALDAGEISLIDYILEQDIYFEMVSNELETAKEFHLAVLDLMQWN